VQRDKTDGSGEGLRLVAPPDRAKVGQWGPATAEDLIAYMEEISGRVFYTRHDVSAWLGELRERGERAQEARKTRKHAFWLIGLLAAFLQYQVLDIMMEVSSLRTSNVVPTARPAAYRS